MSNLPFINTIIGLALILYIFFVRHSLGKNKTAKLAIIGVVLIFTSSSIAEYIISEYGTLRYNIFIFLAIILSHFTGYFFLLFVKSLSNSFEKIKRITVITIVITIVRVVFFVLIEDLLIKVDASGIRNFTNPDFKLFVILADIDEFIMSFYNLILIILAYKTLKNIPVVIDLKSRKSLYYKWGNIILTFSIIVYSLLFINTILLSFNRQNLDLIINVENVIQSVFFVFLSLSMMYFPVFAYTGNYEDLSEEEKQKYKSSALSDSSELFKKIDQLIKDEKLYLDSELKMDKVSKKLSKPIPYISQAINENTQNSFPDYINSFRIEEAKKRLLEETPDTIFAIALDVGFNNKATFYNAFKKNTSMTPTVYRKEYLKN